MANTVSKELVNRIVASIPNDDRDTLMSCSLVAPVFRDASQRRLLGQLSVCSLDVKDKLATHHTFAEVSVRFTTSPRLATHVTIVRLALGAEVAKEERREAESVFTWLKQLREVYIEGYCLQTRTLAEAKAAQKCRTLVKLEVIEWALDTVGREQRSLRSVTLSELTLTPALVDKAVNMAPSVAFQSVEPELNDWTKGIPTPSVPSSLAELSISQSSAITKYFFGSQMQPTLPNPGSLRALTLDGHGEDNRSNIENACRHTAKTLEELNIFNSDVPEFRVGAKSKLRPVFPASFPHLKKLQMHISIPGGSKCPLPAAIAALLTPDATPLLEEVVFSFAYTICDQPGDLPFVFTTDTSKRLDRSLIRHPRLKSAEWDMMCLYYGDDSTTFPPPEDYLAAFSQKLSRALPRASRAGIARVGGAGVDLGAVGFV
ncbi:hypothetical protein MIND_00292300 [Mycena indigotica]|uniref:F-box domain-containing protein n=1 Tax=Mycena indigotica TaxID=2126181 RepID=A0A8H6T9F8_9AGAR|nr:uncharacterized protein MIND_00292300 [Mycena indigotica]KAF7312772.1 hypothetical protein MIND_00292300 [Mycena indigotica]